MVIFILSLIINGFYQRVIDFDRQARQGLNLLLIRMKF